jgi:hypothetical protein
MQALIPIITALSAIEFHMEETGIRCHAEAIPT